MASSTPLATASRLLFISLRRLPFAAHSFCTRLPSLAIDESRVIDRKSKLVKESYLCSKFDVPGLKSKDLRIRVCKRLMIFEGYCRSQAKYDYKGWFYKGLIEFASEEDSMVCEIDQVKAEVKNGVLWVTLPLKEEAKERLRIQKLEILEKENKI